jgi:hypothetical protein
VLFLIYTPSEMIFDINFRFFITEFLDFVSRLIFLKKTRPFENWNYFLSNFSWNIPWSENFTSFTVGARSKKWNV